MFWDAKDFIREFHKNACFQLSTPEHLVCPLLMLSMEMTQARRVDSRLPQAHQAGCQLDILVECRILPSMKRRYEASSSNSVLEIAVIVCKTRAMSCQHVNGQIFNDCDYLMIC